MHFRYRATLGIILAFTFSVTTVINDVPGQTIQIDSARSSLIEAFVLLQRADQLGSPSMQVSQLVENLNLALAYEQNATEVAPTNLAASNQYASMSASLSNETANQALTMASAAQSQSTVGHATAYSAAVAAGFASALFVLEIHRLENLVRRIRMRRARMN